MLCVTGTEATVDLLAMRLARAPDAALAEIRLDALSSWDDAVFDLIARYGQRVLATCRSARQGGAFAGDERRRIEILTRALLSGARFVDIEADVPESELVAIPASRRVLSWHDHSGVGGDARARVRAMVERRPAVVKLAVLVDDPAALSTLLDLRGEIDGDAVVIGMGEGGQLSRTRYRSFGSAWTYVAGGGSTAPGQLDVEEARLLGLPAAAEHPFFALVGGPSVSSSPGKTAYNQLFRQRGLPHSYLAISCRSLAGTLGVLERLGAWGLSVTMPHKRDALELCEPDDLAVRVGVVNSLRRVGQRWLGKNTDVTGVREPLCRVLDAKVHRRALVLGAGGAARAAVEACREIGLAVCIAARRDEQARALGVTVSPWERRTDVAHDVLINATAVGGDQSPWPDGAKLAPVVFDLVMGGRRLLEQAHAARSMLLTARDMWLWQGAEQMSWLLDAAVSVAELSEHMP